VPFVDLIGHAAQLALLRSRLAQDHLHHAYFFHGPDGVGKRTVALSLAMALQCSERRHDFCAECSDCKRVQDGNHPDVRVISPAGGKKEITVGQIRDVEKELRFRPFDGKKRTLMIDPAPLMNVLAQNALLKTLEEPPADSVLILIGEAAGGILPTLLSRCFRLAFGPLGEREIEDFLVERQGMERVQAKGLSHLAMGSLGKALALAGGPLLGKRKLWIEWVRSLSGGGRREAVSLAERLAGEREEVIEFLAWLQSWCRDILVFGVKGPCDQIYHADAIADLERFARVWGRDRLFRLLAQIERARSGIQRNVNRRLALEHVFLSAVERD
jgi:DNA polymerase-3 subunit delta'